MGINNEFPKKLTRDKIVTIKDKETNEIIAVVKLGNRFPYEYAHLYLGIDDEKVYIENDFLEENDAFDRYRDDRT